MYDSDDEKNTKVNDVDKIFLFLVEVFTLRVVKIRRKEEEKVEERG